MIATNPALAMLRRSLRALYGERLARLVLFGFRVHSGNQHRSDYDVALFLHDMADRWAEFDRVRPLRLELLELFVAEVSITPYRAADYGLKTRVMSAIRAHGLDL